MESEYILKQSVKAERFNATPEMIEKYNITAYESYPNIVEEGDVDTPIEKEIRFSLDMSNLLTDIEKGDWIVKFNDDFVEVIPDEIFKKLFAG